MDERVSLIIDIDVHDSLRIERAEGYSAGGMLMLDAKRVRELRDWLNANVKD
jgi:hypothetical protein